MTQNDLIQKLTSELKPVTPMPSFKTRLSTLLVISFSIAITGVVYWYIKKNEFSIPSGHALLEALILFIISIICAALVTRSVSPHTAAAIISKKPLLAFVSWMVVLVGSFILVYFQDAKEALVALDYATWLCPTVIMSISLPIAAVSLVYILRGAVLFVSPTFFYWSMMSLSFGALGLSFICPWTDPLHELLWHLLPVAIATTLIYFIQKSIYSLLKARGLKKTF